MNKEYEDIKAWILAQQGKLDLCIAKASVAYFNAHFKKDYFNFDANETIGELWLLNNGKDLCYDRPSIGFSYSLWYHGRRVNGMLDFFIHLLLESRKEKQIEIFDLGAGTGAIQWVVGLVYAAMKQKGLPVPEIKVVNIDSSPFMLQYSREYLWKQFMATYPECAELKMDDSLVSWVNPKDREYTNVWLCASYLFDHSENRELIAEAFLSLAATYRPQKVILLGNHQKQALIDAVAGQMQEAGYNPKKGSFSRYLLKGEMSLVKKIRDDLNKRGLKFSGNPVWSDHTWYGKVLEPQQIELGLAFPDKYDMYQKAEKDRKKIQLTPEQQKAARVSKRPVSIVGPAGCGKSVVLTEKVKNITEQKGFEYDPKLNILLATFNKDLVEYLGDWLEKILSEETKFERSYDYWDGSQLQHSYFTFKGSTRPNITVMHFDILPTRIGNIRGKSPQPKYRNHQKYHLDVMKRAMTAVVAEKKIDQNRHKSILDEIFLLEEYHRVKYGLQCRTPKLYSQVSREGRGSTPQLQKGKKRREYIAHIFRKYKSLLNDENCESYIIRRERFLTKLNKGEGGAGTFTHVLVDELQDCCRADYDIFYALLNDLNNFTVAGDLAQSINIGTTASVPRSRDGEMKPFRKIYLEGSFRLPFRIGECIKPLSEKIKEKFSATGNTDVYEIRPYKGAPPGARPIFIHDKDLGKLAEKVAQVFQAYCKYDEEHIQQVDVLEGQHDMLTALRKAGLKAEGHAAQKIKGMEKPFVLWDTLAAVNTSNETEEFIYTILTRTTNVLVIAVRDKLKTGYFDIIKDFAADRLIFWDQKSREVYHNICNRTFDPKAIEDEEDEDATEEDGEEMEI